MPASWSAVPSVIAASTTWPRPVALAWRTPAQMPSASIIPPPPMSPIRLSGTTGSPSAGPIDPSAPARAM